MSYILDALKKSEMERRAGSITGLTPGGAYVMVSDGESSHTGVAIMAAVGLLGAGLALGMWHPWQAPAFPEPARAAALPPPSPGALPVAVVPAAVLPVAVPSSPVPPSPPAPEELQESATRGAPARSKAVAVARSPGAVAKVVPRPAAPADAGKRVMAYSSLPAGIRSQLPQFTFGGYAGTDEADSRIAFINNRLVKEGEEVSPGVRLVEAGQGGVVLDFRGYRFRPEL